MAERFEYFTSVIGLIVKQPPHLVSIMKVRHRVITPHMGFSQTCYFFSRVNENMLVKRLSEQSHNKATGLDNITARFLGDSAETVAPCVAHTINLSTEQEKVPSDLKMLQLFIFIKISHREL